LRLTLKFSAGEMFDITLLARSKGIAIDDYDRMTTMIGILVRAELDKIRQPEQKGEGKS